MSTSEAEPRLELPQIPLLRCAADFPQTTLEAFAREADALIDGATQHIPKAALRFADRISRHWLVKSANAHLAEIDAVAESLGRPGAYFLSVNYEWGCTVAVRPVDGGTRADGRPVRHAELVRVLDWRTPGLGRYVVAADVAAPPGRFLTLTWPGYTGVLQAIAPGRFAAAINQAPMPRSGGGLLPLDWLANKIMVWRSTDTTPAHLLRDVFEQAETFVMARQRLIETPIASPAIFSLVGCHANELAVIERSERGVHVHDGARAAANAWQAPNWHGRARGKESSGRVRQLLARDSAPTTDLAWLAPPVLNETTRLAAVFTPANGRFLARGFAGMAPVTAALSGALER